MPMDHHAPAAALEDGERELARWLGETDGREGQGDDGEGPRCPWLAARLREMLADRRDAAFEAGRFALRIYAGEFCYGVFRLGSGA